MTNLQWWSEILARLTRGEVPVDGMIFPAGDGAGESHAESRLSPPREAVTRETEFPVSIYPKWGNFR